MNRSVDHHLERDTGSPRKARAMVRDLCDGWAPEVLVSDVELVVSELVTNAVLHGSGDIVLRLHGQDMTVVVGVRDAGVTFPDAVSNGLAERGRGLALVAALSRAWGVRTFATGKEIWCVMRTEAPAVGTSPQILGPLASCTGDQGMRFDL